MKRVFTLAALALACSGAAYGQEHHHHGDSQPQAAELKPFEASTAKSFATLMDEAMAIMDQGMQRAPMNGDADHDFVTMMIPHHQGAVDMAKAVLLYTRDPAMRNLAQGIITEQQYEIQLMQTWLEQHKKGQ